MLSKCRIWYLVEKTQRLSSRERCYLWTTSRSLSSSDWWKRLDTICAGTAVMPEIDLAHQTVTGHFLFGADWGSNWMLMLKSFFISAVEVET